MKQKPLMKMLLGIAIILIGAGAGASLTFYATVGILVFIPFGFIGLIICISAYTDI